MIRGRSSIARSRRVSVGLSFLNLTCRPPPAIAPVPEPDDWPSIGHWTAAEIAAAIAPLDRLLENWPPDIAADVATTDDDDDDDEHDTGDDPYGLEAARETLAQTLTWLRAAAVQPGGIIVGFYG